MKRTYSVRVAYCMFSALLHGRTGDGDVLPLNVPPDLEVVGVVGNVKTGSDAYVVFETEYDLDRYVEDQKTQCVAPFMYQRVSA